jgi:hypothetical protein
MTAKRRSPKESTIVRAILDELRSRGRDVWFRKNHGGPFGSTGVPDIEVVFAPDPVSDTEKAMAGWVRRSKEAGGEYVRPVDWNWETKNAFGTNGIVVFLEVKRPGEKATAVQDATMAAIKRAGAFAKVVFSKDEAIHYLESLGLPPKLPDRKKQ